MNSSNSNSTDKTYDFCIIGGGFGGFTAAKIALKNNFSVAIVEKRPKIGGACLHEGCIPSKFLLNAAEKFWELKSGKLEERYGIKSTTNPKLDFEALIKKKNDLIEKLGENNTEKLRNLGCDIFHGYGRIKSTNEVEVDFTNDIFNSKGKLLIKCKNIIISTGTESKTLPGNELKIDGENIITSKDSLELKNIPEKLLIVGGGYIGLEMGSFYNRLGSEVTILDFSDRLIGDMDEDISQIIKTILEKQGIRFILDTKVVSSLLNSQGKLHEIGVENLINGERKNLYCDKALIAVGRKPMTRNIGLEEIGVKFDKEGRIYVNEKLQSNISNIYAIGDASNMGVPLAHKAEDEALALFDNYLGIFLFI
jgi:dihydrolipoamide dehydrogenase